MYNNYIVLKSDTDDCRKEKVSSASSKFKSNVFIDSSCYETTLGGFFPVSLFCHFILDFLDYLL